MIYLGMGYLLGPGGLGLVEPDPTLRRCAGPDGRDRGADFRLPLASSWVCRCSTGAGCCPCVLAFPAMALTVALMRGGRGRGLGLSPGEAVLLGGILAPTDPVLASGVQPEPGSRPDRVRFSLAGEGAPQRWGGLPSCCWALGRMNRHELGEGAGAGCWSICCGDDGWRLLIRGDPQGADRQAGDLPAHRHHSAVGLDEFLCLGLIAIFLAGSPCCAWRRVFWRCSRPGWPLHRVREDPLPGQCRWTRRPRPPRTGSGRPIHHASAAEPRGGRSSTSSFEKLAGFGHRADYTGAMLPTRVPPVAGVVHPCCLWCCARWRCWW